MATRYAIGRDGIVVPPALTETVDVLFDDHRVWSFNPVRDSRAARAARFVPWPGPLVPHLDGVTEASLVTHVDRRPLYSAQVRFGESDAPLRIADENGHLLSLDKSGRLQRTFSNTQDLSRELIVDTTARVLADLREVCGLDAYLAYGCLLGAVRDGHMIGHDSDADVSYLSRHTHPFDVILESYRAARQMRRRGWRITRMSGADFKVWVQLGDGRRCGVDVFASFHIGDHFHIMGSLRGRLDRSVVLPLGTVTLEGRELPAPGRVEEFLEFTYGPGWRTPDPAFHFDHDPANLRRMDTWFRATRRRYRYWRDFYRSADAARVPAEPSRFAGWVADRIEPGSAILDVGCGTGRDAVWFAGRGYEVTGIDRAGTHQPFLDRLAAEHGVTVRAQALNLENLAATLVYGARRARVETPQHVYARGLLDALTHDARANFWRLASMLQRSGGSTFLEFRTPASRREPKTFGVHRRTFLDPAAVAAEIARYGGRVVDQVVGRDLAPLGRENPEICRLEVRWDR